MRGVCSRFKFALAVPIQTPCSIATSPRSSQATPAGPTLWSPRRLVLRPRPPTRPRPSTRARCVRRAALGRRASNSAPPPSLSRAPTQPEPSISKSSPRDLEFQYPVVVLNIERARTKSSHRASLARPRPVLGMVLLSLYGVGTGHARLGRSKNPTFQPPSGWLATDEGGERTGDFGKPSVLRGLDIAFGPRFTSPPCVRSTPGTRPPPAASQYSYIRLFKP